MKRVAVSAVVALGLSLLGRRVPTREPDANSRYRREPYCGVGTGEHLLRLVRFARS